MDLKKFVTYLQQYEGLKTTAYQDSCSIWTIGIGSTRLFDGTPVKKGDRLTEEQCYQLAEKEAEYMLGQIQPQVKVPLTDNQWFALLSLTYNIGTGGLSTSSVLKSINEKADMSVIGQNWMKWNKGHVNGQLVELPGLTVRRKSEFKVFSGVVNIA